jgi:hypothetical protein
MECNAHCSPVFYVYVMGLRGAPGIADARLILTPVAVPVLCIVHTPRIRAGGSALARVTRSCLCVMLLCDWLEPVLVVPNRVKFMSLPYCSGEDLWL